MAQTFRASDRGLTTIERAMLRKGWTKTRTPRWWQEAYTTQATIRRFWRRIPIQRESFIGICQAVGIEDWEAMVDREVGSELPLQLREDWGEAPDISSFYGRAAELSQLEQWIVGDRCKLVTLWGMGGMGKTSLAVRLVDQIQENFEGLIWRSLLGTPPLSKVLDDLIQFLSDGRERFESGDIQQGISQAIERLQQQRCLVVFDEVETILCSLEGKSRRQTIGQYRAGYEGYGEFFKRVGKDRHQSCLLLTSREKLGEIATHEGVTVPVRSLQLRGLEVETAKALFVGKGFVGEEQGLSELIELYGGNPLAIESIATMIREVFNGNVEEFLSQNTLVLGDRLRALLKQQVSRLSSLEQELAYWLAIEGEPISGSQLYEDLLSPPTKSQVVEALVALERRSLLHQQTGETEVLFSLQPLVQKYVIEEWVDRAIDEIEMVLDTRDVRGFKVMKSHAIVKNRFGCGESGDRLLVRFLQNLRSTWGRDDRAIGEELSEILPLLRDRSSPAIGYLADNFRQIFKALNVELNLEDFTIDAGDRG